MAPPERPRFVGPHCRLSTGRFQMIGVRANGSDVMRVMTARNGAVALLRKSFADEALAVCLPFKSALGSYGLEGGW